jgi:hypothetical protein
MHDAQPLISPSAATLASASRAQSASVVSENPCDRGGASCREADALGAALDVGAGATPSRVVALGFACSEWHASNARVVAARKGAARGFMGRVCVARRGETSSRYPCSWGRRTSNDRGDVAGWRDRISIAPKPFRERGLYRDEREVRTGFTSRPRTVRKRFRTNASPSCSTPRKHETIVKWPFSATGENFCGHLHLRSSTGPARVVVASVLRRGPWKDIASDTRSIARRLRNPRRLALIRVPHPDLRMGMGREQKRLRGAARAAFAVALLPLALTLLRQCVGSTQAEPAPKEARSMGAHPASP